MDMEEKLCPAAPNYEAMYRKQEAELEELRSKNFYLYEELREKEREMHWHLGFQEAVKMIFGKGGNNQ